MIGELCPCSISTSLCNLSALCASVVNNLPKSLTTETQRTRMLHREDVKLGRSGKVSENVFAWVLELELSKGRPCDRACPRALGRFVQVSSHPSENRGKEYANPAAAPAVTLDVT